VERQAEDLSRAAASLLVYRSVLNSTPAKDFSTIVLHLQKGSPFTLMEAYGSFYRGLASEDVASWQEHLIDQALRGTENPFPRAAAKLQSTDHLIAAVQHDLNVIQKLAVNEVTLATWCKDVAYDVQDAWLAAASTLRPRLSCHSIEQEESSSEGKTSWSVDYLMSSPTPPHVLAPLTKTERAALRSAIASQWQWGEAAQLLEKYHASHDFGIISMHRVLKWTGSRLQAQDVLDGVGTPEALPGASTPVLHGELEGFISGDLTNRSIGHGPVALVGCISEGYRCAMAEFYTLPRTVKPELASAAAGLRLVLIQPANSKDLPDLVWTMSQHPRVRFIVLCCGMGGVVDPGAAAALSRCDGFSWPANSMFIACTTEPPTAFTATTIQI